jgi:translation initiation factor 2B subunit (eIF-2B alpha/beta/delta family)
MEPREAPDAAKELAKSAKDLKKERRATKLQERPAEEREAQAAAPAARAHPAHPPRPPQKAKAADAGSKPQAVTVARAAAGGAVAKAPAASVGVSGLTHIRVASSGGALPPALSPAFAAYAASLTSQAVRGVTDRAVGLVAAVMADVGALPRHAGTALAWALDRHLVTQAAALETLRPSPPSLLAVWRAVRALVARLDPRLGDEEALAALKAALAEYCSTRLRAAGRIAAATTVSATQRVAGGSSMCANGRLSLAAGDSLLVHGRSTAVEAVLTTACSALAAAGAEPLYVIVVDAAPRFGGQALAKRLTAAGARVTYCHASGASSVLANGRVTAVFLGAVSVQGDGSILGEAGQAGLALLAKEAGVPVLALAEGYKLSSRVLPDALSDANEVRQGAEGAREGYTTRWTPAVTAAEAASTALREAAAAKVKGGKNDKGEVVVPPQTWMESGSVQASAARGGPTPAALRELKSLKSVSLSYDLTPAWAITAVVTEAGALPLAALPLALAEYARLEQAPREEEEEGEEEGETEED